jgi:hypothetical protein
MTKKSEKKPTKAKEKTLMSEDGKRDLAYLEKLAWSIASVRQFTLDQFMRVNKCRYPEVGGFVRFLNWKTGKMAILDDTIRYLTHHWDNVEPMTAKEAFQEKNTEKRRIMFQHISPAKIFEQIDPKLIKEETIFKERTRWDKNNKAYKTEYKDSYSLYEIDPAKILDVEQQRVGNRNTKCYMLKMKDTSTEREYFLYIPEEVGKTGDPIACIAWTHPVLADGFTRILRQGDVLLYKYDSPPKMLATPRQLTREEYLTVFSET